MPDNLATGYPRPVDGMFNVALLHTAFEGGHEHANYAPCTLAELRRSGHYYWALGHVHDHAVHCEHPHVVYPGNCQGRSVRETGPKGVVVVDIDGREVASLRHVVVDDIRWDALTITVEEGRGAELHDLFRDALDAAVAIADGGPLIARVTIDSRSAVEAGYMAGAVLIARLHSSAEFRRDMDAARVELDRFLPLRN